MAAAPQPQAQPTEIVPSLRRVIVPDGIALAGLRPGSVAVILDVEKDTPEGRRLGDLGFVRGTTVRVLKRAPLGDPTVYDLRGYRLCLRRTEADRVRVRLG
jgi:ferrous iron transport protein A